ncbi:MAG: EndoU domain-containing protein [Rhodospirillales bacterium]|nr:EndoU domain-containing protein [Rhodospirillales bacterium]
MTTIPALCALLLMAALSIPAIASPAEERSSPGDCADRHFYWSDGGVPINLRHVFCGELRHGRPKGLHSTQLVATSRLIRGIEHRSDEGGGIYSAIVEFSGGKRKLSTFFPDHCSVEQLIRSIEHAATNVRQRHPAWGEIGPSAPAAGLETFCLDNRGAPFDIRLGVLANGRINTAFPN